MKYEYLTEGIRGAIGPFLNNRGEEGWELVQVVQRGATAVLYLKREKPLIETIKALPKAESMVSPSDPTFPSSSEGPVFRSKSELKAKPRGRPKGSKNKAKS